jgi:hypothetical protein
MNVPKIFWGIVLIVLEGFSLISCLEYHKIERGLQILNASILLVFGIYLLCFNHKQDVDIVQGKLVIRKGQKKLKELDLSKMEKIVLGYKTIKIVFDDSTEIFNFSKFNKESIAKLQSYLTNQIIRIEPRCLLM